MNNAINDSSELIDFTNMGSSADPRHRLAYALYLSDQMLAAARKGDWVCVELLDEDRRAVLTDDLFEVEGDSSKLLVDAISALISVNQEISALAEQLQDSLKQQHRHHVVVRNASQSYAAVAST